MLLNRLFLFLSLLFLSSQLAAQPTVGLLEYNQTASYQGYTLIAPTAYETSYLIDNCGRVVHSWPGVFNPALSVYLLDNGQLLRTRRLFSSIFNAGGAGGGVELLDWEANVIWEFEYATLTVHHHHDVEYLPNGHILMIAWELKSREEAIEVGRDSNTIANVFWPDHIIEVAPEKNDSIVWEWHAWDHLIQDFDSTRANYGKVADHPELIDINYTTDLSGSNPASQADWMHINAVDYNPTLDQIILSSRNFSEIWIIDHSTNTEEAASHSGGDFGMGGDLLYRWGNPQNYQRGSEEDRRLYGQHDAHWIPPGRPDAGKIMIFNNGIGRPGGSYSSVDIIDPQMDSLSNYLLDSLAAFGPTAAYWSYSSPNPFDFYSRNISGAERLPNGNTLICEGAFGHVFEIDTLENIVWDYVNPVGTNGPVSQGDFPSINPLFRAYRYALDFPAFEDKELSPGLPIELNPLPLMCDSLPTATSQAPMAMPQIYPNPSYGPLHIVGQEKGGVEILDFQGRVLSRQPIQNGQEEIDLSHWPPGIYWIRLNDYYISKVILLSP